MIGIYDSGLGGLSVLHELIQSTILTEYCYLLDNTNFPYGTKTDEELLPIVLYSLKQLEEKGCSTIIIACNTASSVYLRHKNAFSDITCIIIDIITPTAEHLLRLPSKTFAILATPKTIQSKIYEQLLLEKDSELVLELISAPFLASEVETYLEKGYFDSTNSRELLTSVLANKVLLACTHYPFVQSFLEEILPGKNWITQGFIVSQLFANHKISNLSITIIMTKDDSLKVQTIHNLFKGVAISFNNS
jgi:glutamate racemase